MLQAVSIRNISAEAEIFEIPEALWQWAEKAQVLTAGTTHTAAARGCQASGEERVKSLGNYHAGDITSCLWSFIVGT